VISMSARQQSFDNADRQQGSQSQSGEALTEYRQRQLELGELIRGLLHMAEERHDEHRKASARELLARLAEDRFQLAVVGQFSRGKSTLMNSILGQAYLPTGALPMTSVVTSVHYGTRPRVRVRRRRDERWPIETSLDELVRFVAQASAEREELQVVAAEVEVPAEILRLGFHFIDTPGIGSAIAANTATTKRFLPEADAVIFVTSFDAPLSEPELEFLADVRRHVDKLFFVVNKLDLVSPGDAEAIVRFVRDRLADDAEGGDLRIFAISARDALEAKVRGSSERLAASGLPELEGSLVQFLTAEKARSFLLRVGSRAERVLAWQRFDLELGRAGSTKGAHRGGEAVERLQARVRELIADERRVAGRLLEQVEDELARILTDRSRGWAQELGRRLGSEVEERWPDPPSRRAARGWLQEISSYLRDAAPRLTEDWLRQRLLEARGLLISLAADHLAVLQSMEAAVERLGAETFGVTMPRAETEATWSPADLPLLGIEEVRLNLDLRAPSRLRARPGSRPESQPLGHLQASFDDAVRTYCDELSAALLRGARRWVQDVADRAASETHRAAERVLERSRKPANDREFTALEQIEIRLGEFRAEAAAWKPPAPDDLDEKSMGVHPVTTPQLASGCVICEQIADVPYRYMAHAQWELARREERRAEHARNGGFCPMHTWQYAEIASDSGIAIAYAPLAHALAEQLRSLRQGEHSDEAVKSALATFMPGPDRCPACLALAEAERESLRRAVAELRSRPREQAAPLLCVRHLAAVLVVARDDGAAGGLAERLAEVLERASDDLRTYSLKRESLRAYLLSDEENAAAHQVIANLAGDRELARPRLRDDALEVLTR
jgi:hypothetical protein